MKERAAHTYAIFPADWLKRPSAIGCVFAGQAGRFGMARTMTVVTATTASATIHGSHRRTVTTKPYPPARGVPQDYWSGNTTRHVVLGRRPRPCQGRQGHLSELATCADVPVKAARGQADLVPQCHPMTGAWAEVAGAESAFAILMLPAVLLIGFITRHSRSRTTRRRSTWFIPIASASFFTLGLTLRNSDGRGRYAQYFAYYLRYMAPVVGVVVVFFAAGVGTNAMLKRAIASGRLSKRSVAIGAIAFIVVLFTLVIVGTYVAGPAP